MKNILVVLFFTITTTCFAQWATSDYSSKILTFDSKDHSGTKVQIIDYKSDSTLLELMTDSDGRLSGWVDKLPKTKKYKILASKAGFRDLVIDSVSLINSWGATQFSWPTQFTQILPLSVIPISDTLDFDLISGQTYVVTKNVVVGKNISIANRTRLYFFGNLSLAKGVKISARGVESDSIYLTTCKFILAEGAKVDLSYCRLSNFSIETSSNFNLDTNTKINISHSFIDNSNVVNGKKIDVHLDGNRLVNSQLFSVDSLIKAQIENNVFINSSFGTIANSRIENDYIYDDTDVLKYKIVFDKNVYASDLSFGRLFIQNWNSSILFMNNKIESYRFNPMSLKTDEFSNLFFINNQIKGSFDVSASKITSNDRYNRMFFVNNNMTLNGYSSIKNNGVDFQNNLLNLNTYQMTIHGVHDGCPCVEKTALFTSNTIVNGRLWFNTTTNGSRDAYMILRGNIINAEIVTSLLVATGNILKKDALIDYFKKPGNITDDETMAGWVYHHDKREIVEGSNLYVDSDELLNNSAPFYHGTSPFWYDTTFETNIYIEGDLFTYNGLIGYNPTNTSLANLFPEYKKPSCADTCSVSGRVISYSMSTGSDGATVILTNKETGERRVTNVNLNQNFKFSYLPKGEYIAQVIAYNVHDYSSFYTRTSEPKKANAISVEGHVEGIELALFNRIVPPNTNPYNNGLTIKMSYQDVAESDDELAYRFNTQGFENILGYQNAAKYLPVYLQNVDGSVVYFKNTDDKGTLSFPRIPYGTYKIVAQRYGYKLLNDDVLIINSTNSVVIEHKLIKDNEPTGIEETKSFEAIVPKVMPNPFKDHLTIQSVDLNASIQVSDATGKLVYNQKADNLISTINTSNWPNGVYIVRTGETTVKVVK